MAEHRAIPEDNVDDGGSNLDSILNRLDGLGARAAQIRSNETPPALYSVPTAPDGAADVDTPVAEQAAVAPTPLKLVEESEPAPLAEPAKTPRHALLDPAEELAPPTPQPPSLSAPAPVVPIHDPAPVVSSSGLFGDIAENHETQAGAAAASPAEHVKVENTEKTDTERRGLFSNGEVAVDTGFDAGRPAPAHVLQPVEIEVGQTTPQTASAPPAPARTLPPAPAPTLPAAANRPASSEALPAAATPPAPTPPQTQIEEVVATSEPPTLIDTGVEEPVVVARADQPVDYFADLDNNDVPTTIAGVDMESIERISRENTDVVDVPVEPEPIAEEPAVLTKETVFSDPSGLLANPLDIKDTKPEVLDAAVFEEKNSHGVAFPGMKPAAEAEPNPAAATAVSDIPELSVEVPETEQRAPMPSDSLSSRRLIMAAIVVGLIALAVLQLNNTELIENIRSSFSNFLG